MKRFLFIAVLLLAAGGLGMLLLTSGGRAQITVSAEPTMSKGAAGAKVTIVEFSDYQ